MSDGIKMETKLSGFDEFDRFLQKMPEKTEKKILQKSVTKAMRQGQKAAKEAAPVHLDEQSPASKEFGTLKKNIKVQRIKRTPRGQKGARLHTGDAFWGYIYETGSRYQPANPWFLPAFTSAQHEILRTLGQELGKNIEKEAKALAGVK